MPAQRAISAHGLTKSFNGEIGVADINLTVEEGTILGLIGPSGSGKTTTVRLLAGLLAPSSGEVEVFGERPVAFRRETRALLGYLPQDSVLYPSLTLRQNLDFACMLFGMRRRQRRARITDLVDFLELEGVADRLPGAASGGEKRRIALASALVHSPQLVFLDEPTAGLDPVLRRKLWERFADLAGSGRTLVVTTQYVGEAAYCDHIAVLAKGRVLTVDSPEGLRRQAFGGALVDVVFAGPVPALALEYLSDMSDDELRRPDESTVRIVVDDPGATIPRLLEWGIEHQISIEKADVYTPPFDDIFVELVEKLSEPEQEVV